MEIKGNKVYLKTIEKEWTEDEMIWYNGVVILRISDIKSIKTCPILLYRYDIVACEVELQNGSIYVSEDFDELSEMFEMN